MDIPATLAEAACYNATSVSREDLAAPEVNRAAWSDSRQMPRHASACQHRAYVQQRALHNPAVVERMRRLVALTVVPEHNSAKFDNAMVPIGYPRLMAMYYCREPVIAFVGYKTKVDDGRVLYGGGAHNVLARNWAAEPRAQGGGPILNLKREPSAVMTAFALDWAMQLVAEGKKAADCALVPPPVVAAFPWDHVPYPQEVPAVISRVLDLFRPGGPSIPEWVVEGEGRVEVIRGTHGNMTTIVVQLHRGKQHYVRVPRWCELRRPVAVGDIVSGRLVYPRAMPEPTRSSVVELVKPSGLDALMRQVLLQNSALIQIPRWERNCGGWQRVVRTLRVCPFSMVPCQLRRSVGVYMDLRSQLGRVMPDRQGRLCTRLDCAKIQVVQLDRPPDCLGGLVSYDAVEDWVLDLAGLAPQCGWLAKARDS